MAEITTFERYTSTGIQGVPFARNAGAHVDIGQGANGVYFREYDENGKAYGEWQHYFSKAEHDTHVKDLLNAGYVKSELAIGACVACFIDLNLTVLMDADETGDGFTCPNCGAKVTL